MSDENKVMTVEGARAGQVGATSQVPSPGGPLGPNHPGQITAAPKLPTGAPVAASSLVAGVNRAQAAQAPIPKGMVLRNTREITSPWMRALLYGETNARKTTTAARFGTPENTRIIANRGEDQLIPLREMGYQYALCDTMEKLRYAMMFPENLWPEWAGRTDRVLVIDDYTKARDMALDDNEFNDNGKQQNNMLKYGGANKDMAALTKSLFNKPMHIIGTAFASISENELTHEENVAPDLSKGMRLFITAEFTFVFYIDKKSWMLVTDDKRETYQDYDEKMQLKAFNRVIFAKSKVPFIQGPDGAQRKPLNQVEPMDLRKIWEKVLGGAK